MTQDVRTLRTAQAAFSFLYPVSLCRVHRHRYFWGPFQVLQYIFLSHQPHSRTLMLPHEKTGGHSSVCESQGSVFFPIRHPPVNRGADKRNICKSKPVFVRQSKLGKTNWQVCESYSCSPDFWKRTAVSHDHGLSTGMDRCWVWCICNNHVHMTWTKKQKTRVLILSQVANTLINFKGQFKNHVFAALVCEISYSCCIVVCVTREVIENYDVLGKHTPKLQASILVPKLSIL